ncbi:hypothetical protein [Orgyia leucostigma nucleopolyhedrovirus]|uniref:Ac34 n=1 Tax=Orgyia leucostigma nucleopolyhedrovirus TaxID=490711 RepID=B0FDS8_9ABAC|nr:hypothetical protein [Orgyia leucostigma nucleopolyhedrovirus]ABY65786.1 hypothetical protein [Orgyia leucostigma nucleopolyhedrovirus]
METTRENESRLFRQDLARHTRIILADKTLDPDAHLGDVIACMSVNKRLLRRLKDENFDIVESVELSDETRNYLNVLQTEKMQHCRLCYHKSANNRCEFHKKYLFDNNVNRDSKQYTDFMNSEMGVISFVELYYTYLCLDFWKPTAIFLMRDLTGYDNVKSLLNDHGYSCADDVDLPCVNDMDIDDDNDDDDYNNNS